jgi:hypothetical protein
MFSGFFFHPAFMTFALVARSPKGLRRVDFLRRLGWPLTNVFAAAFGNWLKAYGTGFLFYHSAGGNR